MLRNWIRRIACPAAPRRHRLRILRPPAVMKTVPQPAPDVFQLAAPVPDSQRRGRPLSASMNKTLEAMKTNPDISAAELAKKLSVSQSYARTLLRRAKSRCSEAASAAATSQKPRPARRIETTGPARQPAVLPPACAPKRRRAGSGRRIGTEVPPRPGRRNHSDDSFNAFVQSRELGSEPAVRSNSEKPRR